MRSRVTVSITRRVVHILIWTQLARVQRATKRPFLLNAQRRHGDMPHVSPRLGPLERLSIPMPTYPDPYQTGEQANVAMQAATLLHGTQKLQVHAYTHAAHAIAHARTGPVHTHAHAVTPSPPRCFHGLLAFSQTLAWLAEETSAVCCESVERRRHFIRSRR